MSLPNVADAMTIVKAFSMTYVIVCVVSYDVNIFEISIFIFLLHQKENRKMLKIIP